LRLRQAFGQLGALPAEGKQWVVPLVDALATTLATTLATEGERRSDEDASRVPDAAGDA